MKRYNLVQARGAEMASVPEGIAADGEGNDVVELNIKRGTVSIIVPAALPDDKVSEDCFKQHSHLDLELEDGTHITGWVRNGEAHLEAAFLRHWQAGRSAVKRPARRQAKKPLIRRKVLSKGSALE